jgi:hypothetical protein
MLNLNLTLMKNLKLYTAIAFTLVLMLSITRAYAGHDVKLDVKHFATAPVIDGVSNDAVWATVDFVDIALESLAPEITAKFKVGWGGDATIYVLVERTDDDLVPYSSDFAVYAQEYISVHFDWGNFDADFDSTACWLRFKAAVEGTNSEIYADGRYNGWTPTMEGAYEAALKIDGDVQTLEMSIDLNKVMEMNEVQGTLLDFANGTKLGFEFEIGDAKENTYERTGMLFWADASGDQWNDPSLFGEINLLAPETGTVHPSNVRLNVKHFATAPVIDGVGDDNVWADVDFVDIALESLAPEITAKFKAGWKGASKIYVLVERTDDDLVPYSSDFAVYAQEYISVHFDWGNFDADFDSTACWLRFKAAVEGTNSEIYADGRYNGWTPTMEGAYEAAIKIEGDVQTLEIVVDLNKIMEINEVKGVPVAFTGGSNLGFDFEIGDAKANTYERIGMIFWADNSGNQWDDPSIFGALDLLGLTSVQDLSVQSFKVYPNPASDFIYIENLQDIAKIEIYNIVGMRIREINNVQQGNTIDIRDLSSGIYLINVYGTRGRYIGSQKIIVH